VLSIVEPFAQFLQVQVPTVVFVDLIKQPVQVVLRQVPHGELRCFPGGGSKFRIVQRTAGILIVLPKQFEPIDAPTCGSRRGKLRFDVLFSVNGQVVVGVGPLNLLWRGQGVLELWRGQGVLDLWRGPGLLLDGGGSIIQSFGSDVGRRRGRRIWGMKRGVIGRGGAGACVHRIPFENDDRVVFPHFTAVLHRRAKVDSFSNRG
jgi:hypothetical protein